MPDINLLPKELRTSAEPTKPLPPKREEPLIAPMPPPPRAKPALPFKTPPPQENHITTMSQPAPLYRNKESSSMPLRPTPPARTIPELSNDRIQPARAEAPSHITRITLIPETQETYSSHQGHRSPWIIPAIAAVLALLVNGVMGALLMSKKTAFADQHTQETMLEGKVHAQEKALQPHIVLLQQASSAENLLTQHYLLSRFFTLLEQATLPTTTYQHFTLNESQQKGRHGSLVLLTSSFADMAAQITLFLSAHHMMRNVVYTSVRKEKTEFGEQVRAEVQFDIVSSAL